ncbi:MAG: hypothetical protein GY719_11675 [bacterium]|nr:hypothetical protein [bacterium]
MTRPTTRSPGPGSQLRIAARGMLAILWLCAVPALAAPAPAYTDPRVSEAYTPPRFFIETIAVEGIRLASREVVVSRSLLEEGRPYTEAELREAIYRVHRLPFVLDAAFSLGKGSERGRYRLLISVEEVETFFFGADAIYDTFGGALDDSSAVEEGFNDTLTAGARFFAGDGVFFAAVGDSEDLQVGYTRYRLFDRPVLLRLAVARQECCAIRLLEPGLDPAIATWEANSESDRVELTFGLPIGGNHSLRLDASHLESESATRRYLGNGPGDSSAYAADDVEQREIELAWVYDSTDDPLFPTLGDAMTVSVGLRRFEGDLAPVPPLDIAAVDAMTPGGPILAPSTRMTSRLLGLSFHGSRNWPVSPRQAVSLRLKVLLSRSRVENVPVRTETAETRLMSGDVDALEADLGVRYSLSLWNPAKSRRLGELRWETVAGLIYVETSPVFDPVAHPLWGVSASSSIAWRNGWGVFRIGLAYLDYDGAL